ncbi:MAG: hydrogenase [Candidatus Micrarchaeota archaeon]
MFEIFKFLFEKYPDRIDPNSDDPDIREVAELLKKRSLNPFAQSIHVRMVDAGSPNDVELEEQMMMNPRVDAERFGIHYVASPRHADVIIVTGPVTMNMKLALEKSYDAMADPRVVVAAGDGAVTGFPYQGSYALAGSGKVEDTVPVDVNVPGNPPNPYQLLAGLLKAGMILEEKSKKMRK